MRNGISIIGNVWEQAVVWTTSVALLLAPGLLMEALLRPRPPFGLAVRIATAVALGLAFWPLLFLWTSTVGLQWSVMATRTVFSLIAIAALWPMSRLFRVRRSVSSALIAAAGAVAMLTVAGRLLHARGLALPPWVDSVHHTMIVRLLVEHGSAPSSYAPFIPDSSFYFHWGFHVLVAQVAFLLGRTDPMDIPRLLLHVGQCLNALTPLVVYAAARVLFVSRWAGVMAAAFASLVSYFPAYYLSWGRYTHLAGVLLLPALGIALYRTWWRPAAGNVAALAILAAGVALVHVRVAVFALTLALVLIPFVARNRWPRRIAAWAGAAALAALIAAPWLLVLATERNVSKIVAPTESERARWESSNAAPADLLWAPNNLALMTIASAGLIGLAPIASVTALWRVAGITLWLTLVLLLERRRRRALNRRWSVRVLAVVGWVAVTAALTNLEVFGLPRFRAVPNSAAIITMFLPLSLLAAAVTVWCIGWSQRRRLAAVLIVAAAGFITTQRIVNPATVLATGADVQAISWIERNTPVTARFAVGTQPWIGGSYVGVDGGYWVHLLADRSTTLPPALYAWVAPPSFVDNVNAAALWSRVTDPRAAIAIAKSAGATHLYFGPAHRSDLRARLLTAGQTRILYDQDGVTLHEMLP